MTGKNYYLFAVVLIFSGCGSDILIINSFNHSLNRGNKISTEFFIENAIDERDTDPEFLGGSVKLNVAVAEYFKTYFNTVIHQGPVNDSTPVRVYIEQLILGKNYGKEKTYSLLCSMRFEYFNKKDSLISHQFKLRKLIENETGFLDSLDVLLSQSLEDFISKQNNQTGILADSFDSLKKITLEKKNNVIKDNDSKTTSRVIIEKPTGLNSTEFAVKKNGIGYNYYGGDKIPWGLQMEFRIIYNKSTFDYGYGIGILYYKINNYPFVGYSFSVGLPVYIRYFLSDTDVSLYIGGSLRLLGGTENIEGFTDKQTIFGPKFEEYFGISFNRIVFLEAGFFQLKLFGSDLLPDDIGFRFSFNFSF